MNVLTKSGAVLMFAHIVMFAPAWAQEESACTVEGLMVLDKKQVASKDCFENIGAPHDDFKRVCDAMTQTALAVTKSVGTPPPTVTYGKSCPAGAVATCKGFLFMPIMHHIFSRSEHEMEVARESCLTQNGEWQH